MTDKIKKAFEFASKCHAHKMYDHFPYFKHLEDVYKVLLEFGYEEEDLLIAGILHDSMEDSGISYSDLKKEFGEEVAEVVFCVTDEIGRNRKEKKEKTYPKIKSHPSAVVVKLADRIANTRHSLSKKDSGSFLSMYKKEYKLFRWNLKVEGHAIELWKSLDQLMEWK